MYLPIFLVDISQLYNEERIGRQNSHKNIHSFSAVRRELSITSMKKVERFIMLVFIFLHLLTNSSLLRGTIKTIYIFEESLRSTKNRERKQKTFSTVAIKK
jgi:hypothetical protein